MRRFIRILGLIAIVSLLSACYDEPESNVDTSSTSSQNTSDSVNLNWTPPSTRTDDTFLALSELAGYRIYMGTSSGNLAPLVDLDDESVTQYTVNNLPTGSYYFAITAYDTDGQESSYSQVILVQVS